MNFAHKPILLLNRTVYLLAEPRVSFIIQMIRYAVVPRAVTKRGIDSPFGLTIILRECPPGLSKGPKNCRSAFADFEADQEARF